jgi:hypothetical protein
MSNGTRRVVDEKSQVKESRDAVLLSKVPEYVNSSVSYLFQKLPRELARVEESGLCSRKI